MAEKGVWASCIIYISCMLFLPTEPLYTSQSGDDSTGDGTKQKPFETILCVSSVPLLSSPILY